MRLFNFARFRLAITVVAICAAALAGFAFTAWREIRSARMAAIDNELASLAQSLGIGARWGLSLANAEKQVQSQLGEERAGAWAVAVRSGGKTQTSANWPAEVDVSNFPVATATYQPVTPPKRGPHDDFRRGRPDFDRPPPDHMHDEDDDGPRDIGPLLAKPKAYSADVHGTTWQLVSTKHLGSGTSLWVAMDTHKLSPDLARAKHAFYFALPGALLLVAIGAWWAARRSFEPVKTLSQRMSAISLRQPNERLGTARVDDEYQTITLAYDAMLDRLERSYQQATRFSADASHELKTPLAVMRATLESALGKCSDDSAEQRTYAEMLDQTDQIQNILESLLMLSRADAGVLATSRKEFDVSEWISPLLEDASLLAEEREITVTSQIQPGVLISADQVLLYRACHNLFRNAVAYNEDKGRIHCELSQQGNEAVITVSNTGERILQDEQDRVFERFARGSNVGGTGQGRGLGVGLSLAREICLAHGGTLTLVPDAMQTVFQIRLPVSPPK